MLVAPKAILILCLVVELDLKWEMLLDWYEPT
jgi:hypothetical protein